MDIPHPPSVARITLHRPSTTKRSALLALLVLAYALVSIPVYNTIGQPRQAALERVERLRDEQVASEHDSETDAAHDSEWAKAERAIAEREERQAKIAESERKIPPWYLPNAWAAAGLFLVLTSHALFHLMCHWMVEFKAGALFEPSRRFTEGDSVLVRPHAHRGKAALCVVRSSQRTQRLRFEFQHQTYEHISPSLANESEVQELVDAGDVEGSGAFEVGVVRLLKCPVDAKVCTYVRAKGLSSADANAALENFGKNSLSVPQPNFLELFKRQLLSPLAIFQFFTSILWLLDEYWQYTIFSLINVFVFESTTVFQQIKTRGALKGMTIRPLPVQVFRDGQWQEISTDMLLPGDLVSLRREHNADANKDKPSSNNNNADAKKKKKEPQAVGDIVPCDCVLIRGSAVVNEATLTGESVPQMKDALRMDTDKDGERPLELNGRDRVHVLFSGTSLVNALPGTSSAQAGVPRTPDGGCLAYVLRTGFNSSQGELMQMIEFSTQHVSADSKETGLALLFLLIVALVAAAHVLREGLRKGELTTHELLLKCVIIITSVVPQQLPLQMALAVNTALMSLMRSGIFCTEPYRVPLAGRISHCLFDKTGTLTTDQLVPVGVVCKADKSHAMTEVSKAEWDAAMVLATCHSLVQVEGAGLVGDPIEVAALEGVAWHYDSAKETARPGNSAPIEKKVTGLKAELAKMPEGKQKADVANRVARLTAQVSDVKQRAQRSVVQEVSILHRHHFSSKLQRMSVVCKVKGTDKETSGACCLVKGSPEALWPLLCPDSRPPWFHSVYRDMAEKGMRVLALAIKWCRDTPDAVDKPREWVESDLEFVGFVSFACRTRKDSPTVIRSLVESAHKVAMVTGDAPLTALHVAREVGICGANTTALLLSVKDAPAQGVCWLGAAGEAYGKVEKPFDVKSVRALAAEYELMVTEQALMAACEQDEGMWKVVDAVKVFARMSPHGKAQVIRAMQKEGSSVLMCGDGGNDVGALKQADIGLALLAGYGNANTAKDGAEGVDGQDGARENGGGGEGGEGDEGAKAEDMLNKESEEMKKKVREANKLRSKLMADKRKELTARQQEWLEEELAARRARGEEVGIMGQLAATKAVAMRLKDEMVKANKEIARKHGNVYAADDEKDSLLGQMEDAVPVVRPGDASIAAPFTSRVPSVRSVVDLVRQGRCTMLSALQQQQIMMLDCMIYAFTLAALSLEGARSSERQMMLSGWLLTVASLAFSYSTPIDKMDPVRPIKSLFHPAVFASTLGQAAIHLACMVYAVRLSTEEMGPEAMKEVLEFNKSVKAGEDVSDQVDTSEDPLAEVMSLWSKPFLPNLFNTVVFLVETSQMIAVLLVNYKGRPWMKGVLENHPLSLSLFMCIAGVGVCAWSVSPTLNAIIHLAPFPNDHFRWQVMGLVLTSIVGTFVWDRLVTMLFAPEIFRAMWLEAKKTTLLDLWPMCVTLGKVLIGVLVLGSGQIWVWGLAFWWWRNRKKDE